MWVVCVEVVGVQMIREWVVEVDRIHHRMVMVVSSPAEPLPVADDGGVPLERCAREDNAGIRDA
jgi:hypothetical protein